MPARTLGQSLILSACLVAAGCAFSGCAGHRAKATGQPAVDMRQAVALGRQAEDAQRRGDHQRAIELSRSALDLSPDLGGVWNNLGVSLMKQDQPIAAVESLQRAAELLPNDPRPYENLGHLYRERGFGEDALKYYALSLDRDSYWIPSLRGAVTAAKDLLRADDDGLDRIKRGLMVENDPAWRKVFEAERTRVEQALAERNASLKSAR